MAEVAKKSVDSLAFPESVLYHREHTWAKAEGESVRVGISDYAQDQLGDVIFVELPRVGDFLKRGSSFGVVESAKSVSALYAPLDGEVLAVNEALEDSVDLINQQPYGAGWMILVKPAETNCLDGLLDSSGYIKTLGGK